MKSEEYGLGARWYEAKCLSKSVRTSVGRSKHRVAIGSESAWMARKQGEGKEGEEAELWRRRAVCRGIVLLKNQPVGRNAGPISQRGRMLW